jgi:hypothetical protein
MEKEKEYRPIQPGREGRKRRLTRIGFFVLGMGFQTGYRLDRGIRREIDSWPETFTLVICVQDGPRMVVQKRNGRVQYLGEKETFFADLEIVFKHLEYARMVIKGDITPEQATWHNRLLIKGDVGVTMSVVRVMKRIRAFLRTNSDDALKDEPFWRVIRVRALMYYNTAFGTIK